MIRSLGKGYINLPDILTQFENELKEADTRLDNKGKMLETCLSENSAFMHYYDQRKNMLHTLVKYFEMEIDRIRSELYVSYTENYSKSLSHQQVMKYIDHEPAYLTVKEISLEVEEIYEQYVSAVDNFKTRGFALQHITKLRVAQLEFTEI